MEDKLQKLIDRQEIKDVLLDYCRGIDRMDKSLVRQCYHEDAVDEHGSFFGGVEEYLEWCWRLLQKYTMSMHYLSNCKIDIDGDRARAESYGTAVHRGKSQLPEHNLTTGFRFIDILERRNGQWKIFRRVATTEWVRQNLPEQDWPIPDLLRQGSRDMNDPIYSEWRHK